MEKKQSAALYVLRLGLTLFLITAVVAGLLALVNGITEDKIAALEAEKTKTAMTEVLGEGDTIGDPVENFQDDTGLVRSVTETSGGWVIEVAPSGFGGEISMMVGVSRNQEITGISIISHSETSGLGANAAAKTQVGQDFRGQFVGKSGTLAVAKDGGDVEALTGATVTSRAVTQGVNAALACAAGLG